MFPLFVSVLFCYFRQMIIIIIILIIFVHIIVDLQKSLREEEMCGETHNKTKNFSPLIVNCNLFCFHIYYPVFRCCYFICVFISFVSRFSISIIHKFLLFCFNKFDYVFIIVFFLVVVFCWLIVIINCNRVFRDFLRFYFTLKFFFCILGWVKLSRENKTKQNKKYD